jgi:DNA-binding SARP family transcriptional activator
MPLMRAQKVDRRVVARHPSEDDGPRARSDVGPGRHAVLTMAHALVLELEGGDPIAGTVRGPSGEPQRFRGWAELQALVGHAAAASEREPVVAVVTLGAFAVLRDGRPVGASAWQSRKARDLLKLLVARRGRPMPRDQVLEALWPNEDPARTSNRLSVALSILRSVLGGERALVRSHGGSLSLDPSRVVVDVERFLRLADSGLALVRAGRRDEADEWLEAARSAYTGEFLEEHPYDDWATPLREEARASYLAVLAALAETAPFAEAVRLRLRILEQDPYDEQALLGLVATLVGGGRLGEARRVHSLYARRMARIGVSAAPFAAESVRRAPTPSRTAVLRPA